MGMTHEKNHPKPASLFRDDDEAALVRQNYAQTSLQINSKCFQQVATNFFLRKNYWIF